ncbi:MAG: Alanine-tRNA ligase [Berkelbacteria bacterium GW2011_GWA1_36_9]|uniref:alanine--tRNA ligase n=1 Tax=Berkelbacteria bacterium GW2011_GWA1_36_9 TaxID=1618331 RepID=A0A0G0FW07_9BACT|nr:MAG: Alanine-tRNA ligase [Berkelbacteria bacterium GW2011_GWA1_36_9]
MDSKTLRQKFIQFFVEKGHKELKSASLVPEDDPSVLFTTAGMQQFKKFYVSSKEAPTKNVVTIQPCFRTSDIEEVGDDTHLTFFEMLGNFSFDGYFKKEAIEYAWEFLTEILEIDQSRISATYYDQEKAKIEIKTDNESKKILEQLKGLEKIEGQGEDNFWSLGTENSPGGPTVEFYIDNVEIWNLVFNEFVWKGNSWQDLESKGVDTGMGFERLLTVLQEKDENYQTDLFWPIIEKIEEISGKKYTDNQKEFRIIADHLKASVFAVSDDVLPSNKERGYIVRRLIRRAIVKGQQLGITNNFTAKLAEIVFKIYENRYQFNQNNIKNEIQKEETKFRNTLSNGLKEFEKQKQNLTGEIAFNLYQTYGFPWEMTAELAEENKISVERIDFENAFKKHQELSRTASAGMFKGGLAGGGKMETKYHSATHLLLASLRQILGNDIYQKGSNITAERLRFDFNYPEKLTNEQIKKVEELVNVNIEKDLPVGMQEMTLEEAKNSGAMGVFENKYGDKVKVYSIGNFSCEICGGPHVKSTGGLSHFKILKEESSSAGVRRIKAVLE